jgi:hypothetical protein
MNYSNLDAGYGNLRGFHWYGFDRARQTLLDLTAGQPGGVAVPHGGLPGMVLDRARGRIYGAVTPTGELVRLTIATGVTTRLGRTAYGRPFVYPGRTLWTSSGGRVYFTAGNPRRGPRSGGPYDPAIFNHVHYWDPRAGFGEERTWLLHDTRAIDYARCFDGATRTCFLMDNVGHVYRYRETVGGANWAPLGDLGQRGDELFGLAWVFQVRDDQRKAYIIARRGAFFEFDLATGAATLRGNVWAAEPALRGLDFYGDSAWDLLGRFYFAAQPKELTSPGRSRLVAIDPARFISAIR